MKDNNKIASTISQEQKQFIIDNAKGITNRELGAKFNERFGTTYKYTYIAKLKYKLGVNSGLKFDDFIFGSENDPRKKFEKPIGSETINGAGQTIIKIENGDWVPKRRYMYEKYYGSIPKGSTIIFLNANKNDYSKSNLYAIDRALYRAIANMELLQFDKPCNKELIETAIMAVKVYCKIVELKKAINKIR